LSTQIIDPATLVAALLKMGDEIGSDKGWTMSPGEKGERQRRLLDLYSDVDRSLLEKLLDLKAMTSRNHEELNAFLVKHGFEPCFRPLGTDGIGVATLLDMVMEWYVPASVAQVYCNIDSKFHRGFKLPAHGVRIVDVEGYNKPMAQLVAKNGTTLNLIMVDEPTDAMTMMEQVEQLLAAPTRSNNGFAGVELPTVEVDTRVNLDWLLGMEKNGYRIDQAFQLVKMRINEEGARIKAATGLGASRGISLEPEPLVFDRPFLGFFTTVDCPLPIGVFYADLSSWREPQGNLAEL